MCMFPAIWAITTGVKAAILLSHQETMTTALKQLSQFSPIAVVGMTIAIAVVTLGLCLAVALRYANNGKFDKLNKSLLAACVLMLPAFIPAMTVILVLGLLTRSKGIANQYSAMLFSHFLLHFSIFFFICITLIAAIPNRHVAWQRSVQMTYLFSLVTDGVKKNRAALLGLVGVVVVQVVTDGVVSRWFSYLLKSPEEALDAAVFGRLSTVYGAMIIVLLVIALGIGLSLVIGRSYTRDVGRGAIYG